MEHCLYLENKRTYSNTAVIYLQLKLPPKLECEDNLGGEVAVISCQREVQR